ncbi:hypothetical protein [Pseudomonas sp.]|uniref:hypothetical protein n=1 Tax=Pseudomonas sp. TaxID=306 RepID=UPI003CC6DA53
MEKLEAMLFTNQKLQLLTTYCFVDENQSFITPGYAYAWYNGVYPLFDDSADWHKPYKDFFNVTEEMIDELSSFLDQRWIDKNFITFYDLEDHYSVSGNHHPGPVWDRSSLVDACRYMYLNDMFDEHLWGKLCENMKCPTEAHSIRQEFGPSNIYFL